jgi:hypothetical protein
MFGYIHKTHLKCIHFEIIRFKLIYRKNKLDIIEFNLTVWTLLFISFFDRYAPYWWKTQNSAFQPVFIGRVATHE